MECPETGFDKENVIKKLFLSMTSCWFVNFILRMMISFIRHVCVKDNIRVTYTFKYIIYPRSPSISIYHTQDFKRDIRYTTFLILNYWSQGKCIIWILLHWEKISIWRDIFSKLKQSVSVMEKKTNEDYCHRHKVKYDQLIFMWVS